MKELPKADGEVMNGTARMYHLDDRATGIMVYTEATVRGLLAETIAAPGPAPIGYAYAPDGNFEACVIRTNPFHGETALYLAVPDTEALRKELLALAQDNQEYKDEIELAEGKLNESLKDKVALAMELERVKVERDAARAQYDHAVKILTGVHALLYPNPITIADGRTMAFRPKETLANEFMQELSDRIRAIPDALAAKWSAP